MHDLLFANVGQLTGIREADFATLADFGGQLGLDPAAFDECMESRRYLDRITQDVESARALGLRGTPAYVLDGQVLIGLYPPGAWENLIDAALAARGKGGTRPTE